MNDEDWVELLREAHQEPIDPAHYAAVRARVLAELGRQRRRVWRWVWAGGLAAVALAMMLTPRPRPVGQALRPAIVPEATARVYGPAPAPVQRAAEIRRPVVHRRRALTQVKQEGRPGGPPHQQVTIKLLTDDPNVVIYWIGE
jgi:hypothetical protein